MATTTAPGAYDWIAQLLTGAGNLATASGDMSAANTAANRADPWGPNRAQYADRLNTFMANNQNDPAAQTAHTTSAWTMLQNLLADPSSIKNMPGYQFGENQALEAVNRGAGASGMINSGNRLTALQDRGEGYARNWYDDTMGNLFKNLSGGIAADQLGMSAQGQDFNQLAGLAGVGVSDPGMAARLGLMGRQGFSNSVGSGIGAFANGATGLMNSGALQAIQRALGLGGGNTTTDLTGGVAPDDMSGWTDFWGGGGGNSMTDLTGGLGADNSFIWDFGG